MSQHWLSSRVADDKDIGLALGPHARIAEDKTPVIGLQIRVFQSEVKRSWTPADRHQHAIVFFGTKFAGSLIGDFDLVPFHSNTANLGVQKDSILEQFLQPSLKRPNEITVGSHQQTIHQFDHTDFRSQSGIDTAHFQPNVATANDQHGFRNVVQFQGPRWNPSPGRNRC